MQKRNLACTVAYDGTNYSGFQIQNNAPSIQAEIERAILEITGQDLRIAPAGRTDAGVHARGQVISFELPRGGVPTDRLTLALNSRLPRDIRVTAATEVPDDFHARFSARAREYRYYLHPCPYIDPHTRLYSMRVRDDLDMQRLQELAAPLVGEQDFSSFATPSEAFRHHVREVTSAELYREGRFVVFRIVANAFLWKMVRSIVGTLLALHDRRAGASDMRELVTARDRSRAGTTAAPRGLFFHKVYYDETTGI